PWFKMVLPLAINATIIWMRTLTGLMVSILALLWVALIYGAWFLHTVMIESQMSTGEYPKFRWYTSTLGLSGASWHDIVILVITPWCCVGNSSRFAKPFMRRPRRDAADA